MRAFILYVLITFLTTQKDDARNFATTIGLFSPSWQKHILTLPYTHGCGITVATALIWIAGAIITITVISILYPNKSNSHPEE